MTGKVKGIIAGGAALVILGGALAALKLMPEKTEPDSSQTSSMIEDTSKLLYEKPESQVSSVTVTNENGTYTVTAEAVPPEDSSAGSGEELEETFVYSLDVAGELPVKQNTLSGIISSAASLTAEKTIEENAQDLSKYGLDSASVQVRAAFRDGSEKVLLLGNSAHSTGQVYFCFQGENTVYTVSTAAVSAFSLPAGNLLDLTLVPAADLDENGSPVYPKIEEMRITRSDWDFPLVIQYRDPDQAVANQETALADDHMIVEPVYVQLHGNNSGSILHGLFGLTASGVSVLHPTEETMTAVGLTEPAAVVEMTTEDGTVTLRVGGQSESGGYFAMVDGYDAIVELTADQVPWVTLPMTKMVSGIFNTTYIFDLQSLELKSPDQELLFTMTGEDQDDFEVKQNGQEMKLEYFQKFYQFLLSAPNEEIYLTDPAAAEPDVSMVFTTKNGNVKTVEFFRDADRKTIIKVNGKTSFRCRTSYVDCLISNMEAITNNGDIVTVW